MAPFQGSLVAIVTPMHEDGALDLIVSNINEPPFVYKNRTREINGNNYLKVRLNGSGSNTSGIGAKVKVTAGDGSVFSREAFRSRGFQATMDPVLHFGLGDVEMVDVEVIWPNQSRQAIRDVAANRMLVVDQANAGPTEPDTPEVKHDELFLLLDEQALGIDFNHQGSFFRDRILNPLMPHTLSNLGPAMAVADVNRDGLEDLFIGMVKAHHPAEGTQA